MQEYDVALKSFLRNGKESLQALTSVAVERWHNVELPEVRNLRVDLLGEATDGRLVHIELQSAHDATMALRMMEYAAAVYRQFGRFPEQIVLYVGDAPVANVRPENAGSPTFVDWMASVCFKARKSRTLLLRFWRG